MRALGTQLRLRRLLRAYGDYLERLSAGPEDRRLRAAGRARLLEMLQGLRETWRAEAAESLGGRELAGLRRHVSRSLSAMEAARPAWSSRGRALSGAAWSSRRRRCRSFSSCAAWRSCRSDRSSNGSGRGRCRKAPERRALDRLLS